MVRNEDNLVEAVEDQGLADIIDHGSVRVRGQGDRSGFFSHLVHVVGGVSEGGLGRVAHVGDLGCPGDHFPGNECVASVEDVGAVPFEAPHGNQHDIALVQVLGDVQIGHLEKVKAFFLLGHCLYPP